MTLLSIKNVSLNFGGLKALNGASFDVERGTLTGLIGPNGAGKTTLFNCISGLYRPTDGAIAFAGKAITGLPPEKVTASGLIRTFQLARGFFHRADRWFYFQLVSMLSLAAATFPATPRPTPYPHPPSRHPLQRRSAALRQ